MSQNGEGDRPRKMTQEMEDILRKYYSEGQYNKISELLKINISEKAIIGEININQFISFVKQVYNKINE